VRGWLLRVGLELADRLVRILPRRSVYWLAGLVGRLWHRFSPGRRALVAANLARVCAALGRPTNGPVFASLVRRAFVEHASYYLELLRAPHYDDAHIDEAVGVDDWARYEPILRAGVVVATPHLGNFEPFGHFLAAHGLRATAPVEEIRPKEIFDFILARRGAGTGVHAIPLSKATRPLVTALHRGEIAAVVADRDLGGDSATVTIFGHPARLPTGPAQLALRTGRPLIVAACYRVGPERFRARGWQLDAPLVGDRDTDAAALTEAMGRRFEEAIGQAPEQWWAAFQPYWPDLMGAPA